MSAHTRIHRINPATLLYLTYNHKVYAIPENIIEKYIVNKEPDDVSVPANIVFAQLEKKLTKAGALLKGLRTRENFSQITFAKKIAITQANLSAMENGRRPIGKAVAKRIEKVFGVDYRYFLG